MSNFLELDNGFSINLDHVTKVLGDEKSTTIVMIDGRKTVINATYNSLMTAITERTLMTDMQKINAALMQGGFA